MEVHHHSHSSNPPAGRAGKKWTHYFWEFLMLFLAVFCGFLAESFREYRVERHREKEYMRSLVQDLNSDISDMEFNLEFSKKVIEKLDSLIYYLNEKDPNENAYDLYRLGSVAGRIVRVTFSERTSSQLKNAGNMRLLRNSSLSDSIQQYWTRIKIDESISDRMENIQSKATDLSIQLMSYKYYEPANPADPFGLLSIRKDAKLINSDPKLIAQLANLVRLRLRLLYNYLFNINLTRETVLKLVDMIKSEYHLK